MHTWSDIAHAQQSKRTPRSGHLAACPAHECAQLRTHDRRAVGGEAPRPIQRERERPDRSAREQSETTERAELDSAAPTDRCCPPLAAPRCGRTPTMSRKRPARMGAHIPAQIEHENIIERAMTGPFKSILSNKSGEREAKGAPRGKACTVGMRSVAELSRMPELVGGGVEAKDRCSAPCGHSRAPPAARDSNLCSHERSGGYAASGISMCAFYSSHMHAAHAATDVGARTFRWNGAARLI